MVPYDHWHPFQRVDRHLPYLFISTDTLLLDFFSAVEAACSAKGVPFEFESGETQIDFEEDEHDPQIDR